VVEINLAGAGKYAVFVIFLGCRIGGNIRRDGSCPGLSGFLFDPLSQLLQEL
jgi:hypothetical protein